jgi:anti-anti-sigma regulatory factor
LDPLVDVQVVQAGPTLAVVEFIGEHDLTSNDAVSALLSELVATNEAVVVDLSGTKLIDS